MFALAHASSVNASRSTHAPDRLIVSASRRHFVCLMCQQVWSRTCAEGLLAFGAAVCFRHRLRRQDRATHPHAHQPSDARQSPRRKTLRPASGNCTRVLASPKLTRIGNCETGPGARHVHSGRRPRLADEARGKSCSQHELGPRGERSRGRRGWWKYALWRGALQAAHPRPQAMG